MCEGHSPVQSLERRLRARGEAEIGEHPEKTTWHVSDDCSKPIQRHCRLQRARIMDRMVDLGFQDEVAGLGLFHDGLSGEAQQLVMQPRDLRESGEHRGRCRHSFTV